MRLPLGMAVGMARYIARNKRHPKPEWQRRDAHYQTFEELMTETPWENYGEGTDPRCEHCMAHCGYEPSAALGINARITDPIQDADLASAVAVFRYGFV